MPAKRTSNTRAKPVAVRVLKSRTVLPRPHKHLMPEPADPARERLLWRIVGVAAAVIVLVGAVTIWSNLAKPVETDTFWSNLSSRVAQVGNEFTDFWRQLLGSQTIRPEDQYKELEERVFPPLPAGAEGER